MRRGRIWGAFGRAQPATRRSQTIGEPARYASEFHRGSLRAFTGGGDACGTSGRGLRDFWAGLCDSVESRFWAAAGDPSPARSLQSIDDPRAGDRRNHTREHWGLPGGGRRGDCGDSLISGCRESGRSREGVAKNFVALACSVSEPGKSSGNQPAEQANLAGVVDVVKRDAVERRKQFPGSRSFQNTADRPFQLVVFPFQ